MFSLCCSFDGLDTLAEHQEFLPHKPGGKKEIHFTDVSDLSSSDQIH